jgi:phospholipid/cholesterol/gamma-HCH transport system substrate-binding protein
MSRRTSELTRFAHGVVYLVIISAAVVLTLALNRGSFEDNTSIEVVADRAGLTLASGARVKLRGVDVGRVASIEPSSKGARIKVDLFEDQVRFVPAGVTARIVPPTAFGAKYIELVQAPGRTDRPIVAGARVPATAVTTEFNDTFENLTQLMQAARPEKINRALTASATLLDQKGDRLGRLVSGLENYLDALNPALPALAKDLRATGPVLDVYAGSSEDLIATLDNLSTTTPTVRTRSSLLADLLAATSEVSGRAGQFMDTNQPGIERVVTVYDPVTGALARYSPELRCLLGGIVHLNGFMEQAAGGRRPGLYTYTRFRPPTTHWTYPRNLPVLREDRGPRCYGLPVVDQSEAARPMPQFDIGANPDPETERPNPQDLGSTFFGRLSSLVGVP